MPYRISIYDLRRVGPFLQLDFGLSCTSTTVQCTTGSTFAPVGDAQGAEVTDGDAEESYGGAGIYLVDPVDDLAYHAVRDGQDHAWTTQMSNPIESTKTYLEWVRYPAPPSSVHSLDVLFPRGGPQFPAIPISASGVGPTATTGYVADPAKSFAQPAQDLSTTGLTLPILPLKSTVGSPSGSDSESGDQTTVNLSSDVLFHFDKSNLTNKASAVLQRVAGEIKGRARGVVEVTGYTDDIGSNAVNLPLSRRRAASVVTALTALTPGVHYHANGLGSADPIAPNQKPNGSDNPAGRALNRRVTISFAATKPEAASPPPQVTSTPAARQQQSTGKSITFTSDQHNKYEVTADSLFREGNLLVMRLTLTCRQSGSCLPGSDLGGTDVAPPQYPECAFAAADCYSVDGIYLEDPSTGDEYIALRDRFHNPLASTLPSVQSGASYEVWAYFAAPPTSTTSLDVLMPGNTGEITDVPVSDSPPAP